MKVFKKYFIIPATPEEIYRALTTEVTIRLWTGDLVEIDPQEGGEFSLGWRYYRTFYRDGSF